MQWNILVVGVIAGAALGFIRCNMATTARQ